MNLRELAEKDLGTTLEGGWSLPIRLCGPDGVWYNTVYGQVLYDIVRTDPASGDKITVPVPVVTLRRSSLPVIPQPGENWIVEIPESPYPLSPRVQKALTPTRPPEGGGSIGFIRLYLQDVEQSE